jgi:hypothetical protein
MKTAVTVAALMLFGLAPAIGSACEYNDPKSASVSPIEEMAAASAPAASKAPAQSVAKAPTQAPAKTIAVKVKQAADQKVATMTTN